MKVSRFGQFFFLLALILLIESIAAFFKDGILIGALWLGAAVLCWFIGFYHDVRLGNRKQFSTRYGEKAEEQEMFTLGKNGLNKVRFGLSLCILRECELIFPKDDNHPLVAAVVNKIFSESPSNEIGKSFVEKEDNVSKINHVIESIIKPQDKLKRIITDAVRVQCILSHSMNPNMPKMVETDYGMLCPEPICNLERIGLFVPGGEMPVLTEFLNNADMFFQSCKAELDQQRHSPP